MLQRTLAIFLVGIFVATVGVAVEPVGPVPHYTPGSDDPKWLSDLARFHGHLGPAAVAGARMGLAGLRAVEATGYFDIVAACKGPFKNPPQSCFLDGLQCSTGATLGKQNIRWEESPTVSVQIQNSRTGKTVVIRPTTQLITLLAWPAPGKQSPRIAADKPDHDHDRNEQRIEALSRRIAAMPDRELFEIDAGK